MTCTVVQRWKNIHACVNFFLAWVKSVPSFTVFCCKSEECCNISLYRDFFWHFMTIYEALWYFLASLWHLMAILALLACYTVLWRIHFWRNLCTNLACVIFCLFPSLYCTVHQTIKYIFFLKQYFGSFLLRFKIVPKLCGS